jgi:hypothetical protein
VDALLDLFDEFDFEEIGGPFVVPDRSAVDPDAARYAKRCDVVNSRQGLFLRCFSTEFNLLPGPAYCAGLRRVFSFGPGLWGGDEVHHLGLAQWIRPPAEQADLLLTRLREYVAPMSHSFDVVCGRPTLRMAFVPRN